MKKRLLAMLLCVAMAASLLTVGAAAEEGDTSGTCGDNLTWSLDSDGTLTISGTGDMWDYSHYGTPRNPAPWVTMGQWNWENNTINKVVIGEGVTSVGDEAFQYCNVISEVEFPSTLKTIGEAAFVGNQLRELNLPTGLESIGDYAFELSWYLESVTLPDGLKSIGYGAFGSAVELNKAIVPASVTEIGLGAFGTLETAGPIGSGCELEFGWTTSIPDNAFGGSGADNDQYSSFTSIILPDTITSIGDDAFRASQDLKYIKIPDGVKSIGARAFWWSGIESIDLPAGLETIAVAAFSQCESLSSIDLPDSLQRIEDNAFEYCVNLSSVQIPENVSYIGSSAFADQEWNEELEGKRIYFEGNAPICADSGDTGSFPSDATLYYTDGTSGWLDSENYDPDTGLWRGYKLVVLDSSQFPDKPSTSLELISTYPANGEVIDISANELVLTFNRDIAFLNWPNGSIYIKDYETDEIVKEFDDVQYASNSGFISGSTITIRYGLVGLDVGKRYYIEIDPNVVMANGWLDDNSNCFDGLEKGEWVFSVQIDGGDEFTLGRDTFSFNNDAGPFNDEYYISDEHRAYLMDKGELTFRLELAKLRDVKEYGIFDGACFGMSSMMGLIYENLIPLESIQVDAETTWDLDQPVSNKTLASLITYYQILQAYPSLRFTDLLRSQESLAKELVNYLLTDGEPVVIQLIYDGNNHHTVLAYDIESTSEEYLIYIADPNQMKLRSGNPCIPSAVMSIWKDNYSFSSYSYTAWTGITLEFEDVQLKKILTLDEIFSESNIEFASESYKSLETDAKNFTIVEQSSGRSAVIQDGVKTSGDISVYGPDYLAYGNTSNILPIYYLDVDGDISITFTDNHNQRKVSLESPSQNISAVESNGEVITFMDNGNIHISGATEGSSVLLSSAGTFDVCSGVIIEVDVPDVSIEKSSGRISISSTSDIGFINVNAFDKFDEINLSGTANGNLAYITADNHDSVNEIALSSDTSLIAEATLTNTVVFMSNGGSFVDAQSGISYGNKVVCPANPTKSGYVFGGWYKDEALTEPWDFNEDVVTEYTWLYAKWIDEDELPNAPSHPNWPTIDVPSNQPEEPEEPADLLPFTDVSAGDWFYDYVAYVYTNDLMDGVSDTGFNPNGTMTRAMLWTILARIDGQTVTGESWIETARAWAMSEGVSDGENANGLVTREQFATMLWRYAGEPASDYSLAAYTDASGVSDWAQAAMCWVVENGIITGVSATTIDPQGTATRAQAAAMLMRFIENIG